MTEKEEGTKRKLTAWLLEGQPKGTQVPAPAGRGVRRPPDLTRTNQSFAARLVLAVRDRFDGDAPAVYRAAGVSRKTYSSIVSNENRPVSKRTAVAFALALRLGRAEADAFLRAAGYALSPAILEDLVTLGALEHGEYDRRKYKVRLASAGVSSR